MEANQEQIRLANAKKRVTQLKGFYKHVIVFMLINIVIFIIQTDYLRAFNMNHDYAILKYFSTPIFWGIGLFFHGLFVFLPRLSFVKRWEERKIKEYLNNDD